MKKNIEKLNLLARTRLVLSSGVDARWGAG